MGLLIAPFGNTWLLPGTKTIVEQAFFGDYPTRTALLDRTIDGLVGVGSGSVTTRGTATPTLGPVSVSSAVGVRAGGALSANVGTIGLAASAVSPVSGASAISIDPFSVDTAVSAAVDAEGEFDFVVDLEAQSRAIASAVVDLALGGFDTLIRARAEPLPTFVATSVVMSAQSGERHVVGAASCLCFPADVVDGAFLFRVRQVSMRTLSLKMWISRAPAGIGAVSTGPLAAFVPGVVAEPLFTLHDAGVVASSGDFTQALPPGRYFVNVLNRANTPIEFQFSFERQSLPVRLPEAARVGSFRSTGRGVVSTSGGGEATIADFTTGYRVAARAVASLHPFTIAAAPGALEIVDLDPSSAIVYPVTLVDALRITGRMTANAQDRSVRVWISDRPLGMASIVEPIALSSWTLNRNTMTSVVVHTGSSPEALAARLEAGDYFVNVLNLSNTRNQVAVSVTRPT